MSVLYIAMFYLGNMFDMLYSRFDKTNKAIKLIYYFRLIFRFK